MKEADQLDIVLAIVDGLLRDGPVGGSGIPANRYQRVYLAAKPFIDLWRGPDAFLKTIRLDEVDISRFCVLSDGSDPGEPCDDYLLARFDVVSPKVATREGVPIRSRRILRSRDVFVDYAGRVSGRSEGFEFFAQEVGRGKWLGCHSRRNQIPWRDESFERRIQVILGLMWESYFHWEVEFIGESGCSFVLPTTPEGAREMFADRDKPPDRRRRRALRHWVRQHSRHTGKGDTTIPGHLRCREPFSWRGYRCRLVPSRMDQNRSGKVVAS